MNVEQLDSYQASVSSDVVMGYIPKNPQRMEFRNIIAKRQQDCCLPVTVVVRSEAGLLRASGSSRAACESVVPEQPVTALFYSSL